MGPLAPLSIQGPHNSVDIWAELALNFETGLSLVLNQILAPVTIPVLIRQWQSVLDCASMAALMHTNLAQITNDYLVALLIIHAQTHITHDAIIVDVLIYPNVSERILRVDYQLLLRRFCHFLGRFLRLGHFFNYSFCELNLFIDSSLDTFALARLLHSLRVNLHAAT